MPACTDVCVWQARGPAAVAPVHADNGGACLFREPKKWEHVSNLVCTCVTLPEIRLQAHLRSVRCQLDIAIPPRFI